MPPKRILHVNETPIGGVVTYLQEIVREQVAFGAEAVDVIVPEAAVRELSRVAGRGVTVIPFEHRRGSPRSLAKLAALIVRHARATRPDIVHAHSTIAGAVVRLCRPFLPSGTKVVYCAHGWAFSREGSAALNGAIRLVERGLAPLSDQIVCICDHEKREALAAGISERRLTVIENGIGPMPAAAPETQRPSDGRRLVAFVGRFDRQKGFDIYLDVMRELRAEARGVAVGKFVLSAADMPDVPDNVEIHDWMPRTSLFALYSQADIVLMPSRWEGFGLVAVEAMQARTAVFASRVGGLQDIVVDRRTGRLFQPDDVPSIVRMIREASDDDLKAYGERGHARYLGHYTARKMNDQIASLYEDLVGEPSTSPAAAAPAE